MKYMTESLTCLKTTSTNQQVLVTFPIELNIAAVIAPSRTQMLDTKTFFKCYGDICSNVVT